MLSPEREKEITALLNAEFGLSWQMGEELLAEIDALRAEILHLSNVFGRTTIEMNKAAMEALKLREALEEEICNPHEWTKVIRGEG